jgi:hypothetical protein
MLARCDELLQLFVRTFGNDLDSAVGTVAHPTAQRQLASTVAHKETETDPLHYSTDNEVNPLVHRPALLHQIRCRCESPPLAEWLETLHVTRRRKFSGGEEDDHQA